MKRADAPEEPGGASPAAESGRLIGIALMCGAVLCFALCDCTAKWSNQSLDPLMTTWVRYATNMAIVAITLNPVARPALLRSNRPALQLVRSVLLLFCTVLNFLALRSLQLTEAMAILFTMPLFVAFLAGPMLGEWPGRRRLVAIGVGFCGVLVVTRPFGGSLQPAAALSLASAITYALYVVVTRQLASVDRSDTTVFYSGLAGAVLLAPVLPFVWSWPSSGLTWLVLGSVGLFASIGHWLLVLAHARAPAPVLSPFLYVQIVWAGALGAIVFGDVPDRWTMVGAAIVVASGMYLLWWERRRRRPLARA